GDAARGATLAAGDRRSRRLPGERGALELGRALRRLRRGLHRAGDAAIEERPERPALALDDAGEELRGPLRPGRGDGEGALPILALWHRAECSPQGSLAGGGTVPPART